MKKEQIKTNKNQGENMEKQNQKKGRNMTEKKPMKIYQEKVNVTKTRYSKKVEEKLGALNIKDFILQKLINTTLLSLYKLNPKHKLEEVDFLLTTLDGITNIEEIKNTIRLINSKLKNEFKPVNNVYYTPLCEENKIDTERLKKILFDNRFLQSSKFYRIFYALSLLSYETDKLVIKRVNNLSDNELIHYVLKNHKHFSFKKTSLTHLYPYGGGKQKFFNQINEDIKGVIAKNNISKFIDPFMGGLGSFYSSHNSLREKGISTVLNDLNPSLVNLSKMVKGKMSHKKVIKGVSQIVRTMFIKFDTCNLTFEEYKVYHKNLLNTLNKIEKRGLATNPILSTSILLFIMNNGFGGNYKMTDKGSYISPSTDLRKVDRVFNFVGKVEFYHYLFNSVRVKFENKNYKDIIKKYSNKKDTFTTFDPPYLGKNFMSVNEFDNEIKRLDSLIGKIADKESKEYKKLMTQRGKLYEGCKFNYGKFGDHFPHEELLKDLGLVKGHLNYFNYTHPLVEKYSKKYGWNIQYLGRKSTNGRSEKGQKIKEVKEVFMTSLRGFEIQQNEVQYEVVNNIFVGNQEQNVS